MASLRVREPEVTGATSAPRRQPFYLTAYEDEPPGVFCLYWLVYALFGFGLWKVRLLFAGIVLSTGLLLLAWLRRAGLLGMSLVAATLYPLLLGLAVTGNAYTEVPMAPCTTAAMYAAWRGLQANDRGRHWLGAGAALGLALVFKHVAVFELAALGLLAAWVYRPDRPDTDWVEHFLRDCGEQNVKLDFVGVHFYGNIFSLDGEWTATYPPFTDMLGVTKAAIDKYYPGLPLQITEWGPSYFGDTSDSAAVNANNVGAAWGAAFLNTMLGCGVDKALYLITTDLRQQENGNWVDEWGNESLFLDPIVYGGKAYPKPMYHVFEMVSRLEGHRIESTRGNDVVNCFVSADQDKRIGLSG